MEKIRRGEKGGRNILWGWKVGVEDKGGKRWRGNGVEEIVDGMGWTDSGWRKKQKNI